MITTDAEYTYARSVVADLTKRLESMRKHFAREGHTAEEIKRLTDPIICILNGRQEEVEAWEKAHTQTPERVLEISLEPWVITEADYVEVLSKLREVEKGVNAAWKKLRAAGLTDAEMVKQLRPSLDFLGLALSELNDYERTTSRPLSVLLPS